MPANLSKKEQKQIRAVIERNRMAGDVPHSAQQSIPFERMFPDGICRVHGNYYTKTLQFNDINYQLAQQEDQSAIFEEWCSFLNFFDSSIHFELSFMNMSADMENFERSVRIPLANDKFDPVRAEYSEMLKAQMEKGNNGLVKTKYLTFGIEAASMRQAKPRLSNVETDLINNFHRLGVAARVLDGKERLALMHDMFHMGDQDKFYFDWKQYRLEDQLLKYFPREMEQQRSNIEGFQKDVETVAAHQHPKDGFAGMTVAGQTYTEKADAGKAILSVCKMANAVEGYPMGSYRGFQMELSFDSFSKEFNILLKGSMTHRVSIGSDARGNLIRLDNALNNIPAKIEQAQTRLEELEKQQEAAQEEVGKPFPQEQELTEKSARLAELDAALNLEEGPSADRNTAEVNQNNTDREEDGLRDRELNDESRSSVLVDLKQKAGQVPPRRENNWRGEEVL